MLAAGRRPLDLEGELTCPLAPPAPEEALALLAARAAAADPSFAATDANRAALAEICARLDGIPLALELAAGRLRALSPEQVLARLEDRFALLTGGARGVLPRHRTLRTAIGWSHELCTAAERLLWARLSVFAGHFDLDAAEYVCAGPDLPVEGVLDLVGELLAQSLLVREETAAGPRYRMLETVRVYGAGWLESAGDAERLRRRHRDWYTGLATWCELEWFGPRQEEVAAQVEAELPNLRLALECCLDEPDEVHLGQYLAGTLWFYWAGCGRLTEGRHWLDRALDAPDRAGAGYEDARLKALWVLGYVAALQGDAVAALRALHECREGAAASGNPLAAAYAVHRMGCLALVSDDMARAGELLGSALRRYRAAGELNSNVLMCQVELAMALAFQGSRRARARCARRSGRSAWSAGSAGRRRTRCTSWRTGRWTRGTRSRRGGCWRSAWRSTTRSTTWSGWCSRWSCSRWSRPPRAIRRRRRCSRARRSRCGAGWGSGCSARGTSTRRG